MTLEEHRQRIKSDWMDKVIYPPIVVSDKPLSYFSENNNKRKKKMLYSDYFVTAEWTEAKSGGWFDAGEPSKYQVHVERRSLKTLEIERVATFYDWEDACDHADFRNRRAEKENFRLTFITGTATYPTFNYL